MNWKEKYGPLLWKIAQVVAAAILGAVASWLGIPPEVVEKVVVVEKDSDEYAQTFGWVKDEDAILQNLDEEKTLQFHNTPAGKAVLGDDQDAFLWRAVRKAGGFTNSQYPNVNQGPVGSCVGAGNKHAVDVLQAVQIVGGANLTWKPVSLEVIYAGSRVEIGGGRIRGDGSVGSWAAKWLQEGGVAPMEKVGGHDLTQYSPSRARAWGRSGVPDDLEVETRKHTVKSAAVVRSAADVKRAILQGYPVPICSDQGFTMERDRNGFCSPRGSWAHCMAVIGYRSDKNAFFILNSWGDNAHTGPVWPEDAPKAGFWCDWNTMDRIARQGDSFALSDVEGFPGRKLPDDWLIRRDRPVRHPDAFAQNWSIAP
jgi:hypothetical protein